MDKKRELEIIFETDVKKVNNSNYIDVFNDLVVKILNFKGEISNDSVLLIIQEFLTKRELEPYQEEIFIELSNRLTGNCANYKIISLE